MKYIARLLIISSGIAFGSYAQESCNNWNWNIQAGVAPTVWIDRSDFTAVSCNATSVLSLPNVLIPLFKFPQFNHLFHAPWIVGISISHESECGLDLFAQFDYRRAKERTFTIPNLIIPNIDTISFAIVPQESYQALDAFLGLQYHYALSCINAAGFCGAKVGLIHRFKMDATFITNSITVPFENETMGQRLFQKNTVPAVGAVWGLSGCISEQLSWCLQVELVAGCGPRVNTNIPFEFAIESVLINPLLAPNNFLNEGIQTEIYFPLTFGFKYLF
ncbi:hypothetical protein BH09DEP1_BH09DEP1_3050 [soil metagenome]